MHKAHKACRGVKSCRAVYGPTLPPKAVDGFKQGDLAHGAPSLHHGEEYSKERKFMVIMDNDKEGC